MSATAKEPWLPNWFWDEPPESRLVTVQVTAPPLWPEPSLITGSTQGLHMPHMSSYVRHRKLREIFDSRFTPRKDP